MTHVASNPSSPYAYAHTRPTDQWPATFYRHASDRGFARYASTRQDYLPRGSDRLPDGVPIVPSGVVLRQARDGSAILRFDMTTVNLGRGPLEIALGDLPPGANPRTARLQGLQLVYNKDAERGKRREVEIDGKFQFHRAHDHIHFEDFARYELLRTNGSRVGDGKKVSFQITNTDNVNGTVVGPDGRAPLDPQGRLLARPTWGGAEVQGMNVGFGDTYTADLPGQGLRIPAGDIATIAPGGHRDYVLRQSFDPSNRIVESNDGNNVIDAVLRVHKDAAGTLRLERLQTHRAPVRETVRERERG